MAEPITLLSEALAQRTESPVDISSAANPRYRQLTELFESARARRRAQMTVLEGWHLLESWLTSPRLASAADDGGHDSDAGEALQNTDPSPRQQRSRQQALPAIQSLVLPQRTWRRLQASRQTPATGPVFPPVERHAHDTGGLEGGGSDATAPAVLALKAARWLVLDDRLFDSLDVLPSPAPVLALVPTPQPAWPDAIAAQDVVILDRVQDPGNVGAIIRTAAAAGIGWLISTPGTAACWAPKVLRAGMGGHFAMRIIESVAVDTLLARLQVPLVGTVVQPGRTRSLYEADLRPPVAWVFGNEGEGIDGALQARLEQGVTIPQTEGVESLNVAAAAAICLFEQRRQRLLASA